MASSNSAGQTSGPLSGIRVVDLTIAAVGPWSTMLLATLGADVIKVEPPKGDIARAIPPPQKGLAVVWMHSNLGKRSICLDLYREDHRKAMLKLVEGADILVENMRPGTVDRLGIGYAVASRVNPRIIFCSASGYGWSGPWRDVGAADAGMQCFSGWTSVTGTKGGRGELLRYVAHADITTSSYIAASVLLALYARERTGRGQRIETSMFAACLQLEATRVAEYFASGEVPRPMGTIVPTTAPHEAFAASDGALVCVGVTTQSQWQRLCDALGLEHLRDDPRYASNAARVEHREALAVALAPVFSAHRSGEIVELLQRRHNVPCSLVWTREQVEADQHVRQAGHIQSVDTPVGPLSVSGAPWSFSGAATAVRPPPWPGEHTREVMREAGHDLDEIIETAQEVLSTF